MKALCLLIGISISVGLLGCGKKATSNSTQTIETSKPTSTEVPQPTDEEASAFLASLKVSEAGIGIYTDLTTISMGERPIPGTIFNLNFMKAVQKIPHGYLMQWTPPGEFGQGQMIFLQTELELTEGAVFLSTGY